MVDHCVRDDACMGRVGPRDLVLVCSELLEDVWDAVEVVEK